MFLTTTDYEKQIKADVLETVIRANPDLLPAAERAAMAEMESYLAARYDTVRIWAPPGQLPEPAPDARNALIVMYLVDIVLYHLHAAVAPRQVPQIRVTRYEAAIEWLTMVSKLQLSPDLPGKIDENGQLLASTAYAGYPKRNMDY